MSINSFLPPQSGLYAALKDPAVFLTEPEEGYSEWLDGFDLDAHQVGMQCLHIIAVFGS